MKTKIEWADRVWNPVTGCTKVSQGCKNCYAETMAKRFWGSRKFSDIEFHEDRLNEPLKWRKPSTVFVCSMSDLFHESVRFEWIDKIFDIISKCPQHQFLILSKRPKRYIEYFQFVCNQAVCSVEDVIASNESNIYWGVSIEDQNMADDRIPKLFELPVANRFVSIEPMLGAIELDYRNSDYSHNHLTGEFHCSGMNEPIFDNKLDWVIVGGESGNKARPMNPDWVYKIKNDCQDAGVPFFFKQWGAWRPEGWMHDYVSLNPSQEVLMDMHVMCKVGKTKAGRELYGTTYNEVPANFPQF